MKLFSISTILLAAALALVGGAVTPAVAQDQKKPELMKSELKATHGSWEVRCVEKNCFMTQTFADPEGRPVIIFTLSKMAKPKKTEAGEIIAKARIITPLRVLLPNRLGIRIDGGKISVTPFLYCTPLGCEAHPHVTAEILDQLKSGKKLEFITALPTPEGPKGVAVEMSLAEFNKAYGAI